MSVHRKKSNVSQRASKCEAEMIWMFFKDYRKITPFSRNETLQ